MRVIRIMGIGFLVVVLNASLLGKSDDDRLEGFDGKFYVFASAGRVSGVLYPARYERYRDNSSSISEWAKAKSKNVDFALGLGHQSIGSLFMFDWEASLMMATFADAVEVEHYAGWDSDFNWVEINNEYAQTERKLTMLEFKMEGGVLPFRRFPCAFLAGCGLFLCSSKFRSGYIAEMPAGIHVNSSLALSERYGEPDSSGLYSKSPLGIMLGTGIKFFLLNRISFDLRYEYYGILGKTHRYYGNIKETSAGILTLGNRLSVGLAYYF